MKGKLKMKIALYIDEGIEQIVLTPQSDSEKAILEKLHDGTRELHVKRGSFYSCRGGWMKQSENEDSTMLVLHRRPDPR